MRSPTHDPMKNDAPALVHMLERALRCDERAAQIEVDHAVELLERRLLEFLRDRSAGIVDEHVEPAQSGDRLVDRGIDLIRGRRVRLHGDRLAARAFDRLDDRRRRVRPLRIGDGDHGAVGGQTLGDRSANPS